MDRKPIAVAVVVCGGKCLVGQRPLGDPWAGKWEFPGGKIEPPETPQEAAERECLEETGIPIVAGRMLWQTDYNYPNARVTLSFVECTAKEPSKPQSPFVWLPLGDLQSLDFFEANRAFLQAWLSGTLAADHKG